MPVEYFGDVTMPPGILLQQGRDDPEYLLAAILHHSLDQLFGSLLSIEEEAGNDAFGIRIYFGGFSFYGKSHINRKKKK
jgi:hypothetical protein